MGEKIRYVPPNVVADTVEGEVQGFKDRHHVDHSDRHPSFPTLIRDLTASKDNAEADLTELGEKAGVRLPRIKW